MAGDFGGLVRGCGGVFTLGQAEAVGISRARVRWALERRVLIRLRHGVFTTSELWGRCSPRQRHQLLLLAHQSANPALIGCGLSAATALGLPLPSPVTSAELRRRHDGEEVFTPPGGPALTPALRTVADCARKLPVEWGLAVADAAVAARLIQPAELVATGARSRGPGSALRWVAEHARPLVESPLESLARAIVVLAGYPEPMPQRWIETARGPFRVDLLDEANKVIIEADGKVKYTSADDVWREKRREDALRDCGFEVARFTYPDVTRRRPWLAGYARALHRANRHST